MSDHQFEKNVRQQLEELKFHPDAAVWTSVKKRIASRKRKRRGIVWIPVLLLLTATGYWMLERNQKNNNKQTANEINIAPEKQQAASGATQNDQQTATSSAAPDANAPTLQSGSGVSASAQNKVPVDGATPETKLSEKSKTAVTPEQKPTSKATSKNKTMRPVVASTSAIETSLNNTRLDDQKQLKDSGLVASVQPSVQINESDSVFADSSVAAVPILVNIDSAAIAMAPPVEKRRTNWQWGVNLQGGFSNVTDGGFFDVTQKSLVQDVAANSFSSPLPANAVLPRPSDIRPASSFAAGVFIKKPVSKRIDLSAGLHYTFLQTSIQVGQWTQSNYMVMNARGSMDVNAFYRSGTQQKYYNQYHFLEVPVQASLRLNKRRQYPLTLNTGMVVGRLINSNALHFDGASRVYYKDNSLFNKTQFGFSGGLSIGLLQRTAHPVAIGPFLHYRVTNLMKHPVSGERHLLSFGLDIKVLMKK